MSDDGLIVPIELEPTTARRIVAAVILQARRDVAAMENRRARNPEAEARPHEIEALHWLQDTTSTRPFSYRWCLDVLTG